ncbi:MAG: hypothetical protein FWE91_05305 [Defluviitaleaceae bacterium]|nr:hypothetical protein [Defluviitaleaceae bacterium]MCL2836821.1 hypothetical protein [Defluviitaleaceae bacterium]
MAKKKQDALRVIRKRNMMLGSTICIAIVVLIAAASVAYSAWDRNSKSYIGTVGGERVPSGLYRLNLIEQQARFEEEFGRDIWNFGLSETYSFTQWARDLAYSSAMSSRLEALKAAEYGADFLTEEQAADVESLYELYHLWYPQDVINYIGLSGDEMRQAFKDSFYAENLFTMITDERFVHDAEAFEEYFDGIYDELKHDYTRYGFHFITNNDFSVLSEAQEKLLAGADFEEVMAEYSDMYRAPEEQQGDDSPEDGPADESGGGAEDTDTETAGSGTADSDTADPEDSDTDNPWLDILDLDSLEDLLDFEGLDVDFIWDLRGFDVNRRDLFAYEMPFDIADTIFSLEEGEMSGIITLYDEQGMFIEGFVIIKLLEVREPDMNEIKRDYERDNYIPAAKRDFYVEIVEEWAVELGIEMNERAFESIRMFRFQ